MRDREDPPPVPNAFAEEFLRRFEQEDEPPSAAEADVAGPWRVEPSSTSDGRDAFGLWRPGNGRSGVTCLPASSASARRRSSPPRFARSWGGTLSTSWARSAGTAASPAAPGGGDRLDRPFRRGLDVRGQRPGAFHPQSRGARPAAGGGGSPRPGTGREDPAQAGDGRRERGVKTAAIPSPAQRRERGGAVIAAEADSR